MKHKLRKYQEEAIQKLSLSFREGKKHNILMVATGGGKTSIASAIIQRNIAKKSNFKAMFICDRIELINQTSERFFNDGIDHGVIQAEHPLENYKKNIQIASVQTLSRRDYKKDYDIIFIDECHTLYTEHKNLLTELKETPIVGLTATPFTKGLGNYFDSLVIGSTTKQLIELGFLVNYKVFAPSKPDLELIKVKGDDYDENDLFDAVNKPKLIGDIVEHYIRLGNKKPAICFAVNVKHSKALKEEFLKSGVICEHLDAYTKPEERKEIIKSFKAGDIQVLTSVDILSKGFDYPGAEVCILARPTKSLSLYLQQVGRVLRINDESGKEECLILDHSGNTESLGFCDDEFDFELDKSKVKKGEIKFKKQKKEINDVCPSCFLVKNTYQCKNCGFLHQPKNSIVTKDGYLIELEKEEDNEKKYKQMSAKEKLLHDKSKELIYNELYNLCLNKGWKTGRAYYLYKDLVNQEPSEDFIIKKDVFPSFQIEALVKHLQIKKAKSKYFNKVLKNY